MFFFTLFFLILPPTPKFTLFPYTTLFRSRRTPSLINQSRPHLCYWRRPRTRLRLPRRKFCQHPRRCPRRRPRRDRKSTRLNSSHPSISYAVFCLKKKIKKQEYF